MLQNYAFFNFARHYLLNRNVGKNFEVDDAVLQEFRDFLNAQKISYTEADLVENNEWVRSNIKSEVFISQFGQQEGLRVRAETDPQVLKAIEMLPRARELAENARRTIAERNAARMGAATANQ
jgi:carboxyl-terminal processing protease